MNTHSLSEQKRDIRIRIIIKYNQKMVGLLSISYCCCTCSQSPISDTQLFPARTKRRRLRSNHSRRNPHIVLSVLGRPPLNSVIDLTDDDIFQTFLKERELSGDFISRVSDTLWLGKVITIDDRENDVSQQPIETLEDENEGGFLKLTKTREWIDGDNSAPVNKKMTAKELQDDRDKRKILNLLQYEALKREMLLLTVSVGTACSGYCLVALSVQAALSYGAGVLFSCLYLQLLCKSVDNFSRDRVPQIFMEKKEKKIGIRSQDLKDSFEKVVQGSGIALSSPRLVIPAAIYGLWGLSQHFANDIFDFQLLPAMVGLFAYKAAALVQVYRDNEDLLLIFTESEE